jgi:hypothetical protein
VGEALLLLFALLRPHLLVQLLVLLLLSPIAHLLGLPLCLMLVPYPPYNLSEVQANDQVVGAADRSPLLFLRMFVAVVVWQIVLLLLLLALPVLCRPYVLLCCLVPLLFPRCLM